MEADPTDYDSWLEWTKLEETHGEVRDVREVFERAVSNVPPATEKKFWRRYIYLWINYAIFEELTVEVRIVSTLYCYSKHFIPTRRFAPRTSSSAPRYARRRTPIRRPRSTRRV